MVILQAMQGNETTTQLLHSLAMGKLTSGRYQLTK